MPVKTKRYNKKEWTQIDMTDLGKNSSKRERCFCGRIIRKVYTVQNLKTNEKLLCGSRCVTKLIDR